MPLNKSQKEKLIKLKDSRSWKADCCICGKPLDPEATRQNTAKQSAARGTISTVTA